MDDKKIAVMSQKEGELELRILENERDSNEYCESLKNREIPLEFYFEIPTKKSSSDIVSDFRNYFKDSNEILKYNNPEGGFKSLIYPLEKSYKVKEQFLSYLIKENKESNP